MSEDDVMAQWRQLRREVEAMASKAAADPVYLATLGLQATPQDAREPPQATLLRACAEKLIPEGWEWAVVLAMGGFAYLTLRAVRQEET